VTEGRKTGKRNAGWAAAINLTRQLNKNMDKRARIS